MLTIIYMEHQAQAPMWIKGRTVDWLGCKWEVSRRKAKNQIIIIIIRILRYWIISSPTARTSQIRRAKTLAVAAKVTVTNLNLEADSLTTQTFLETHLLTCKKGVLAMAAVNKITSRSTWLLIRALARATTWMPRWQVTLTTYPSWPWVRWRAPVESSTCRTLRAG